MSLWTPIVAELAELIVIDMCVYPAISNVSNPSNDVIDHNGNR